MIRVSSLALYPVKSCAPLAVEVATVAPRGLAGDRRWMIVDAQHAFITGRSDPRLVLVQAVESSAGLRLRAPGMPELLVPRPAADTPRTTVTVWTDAVAAVDAGSAADQWISRFVGHPCHLVFMDDAARRAVDPRYAQAGDEVSFADAYPLLLISQASLDNLNAKLAAPVSMLRFRPNLVVNGAEAHEEDRWRRIRIAGIDFDLVKPCIRCGFTTVIPETGALDPRGEPLRTLATYRRAGKGVIFGQNVIARGRGPLKVGDAVEVLE